MRWADWARNNTARGNIPYWRLWPLVRELLREHDSHSYAALAGWSYVPSEVERAVWTLIPKKDGYERYEPWTDPKNDIMRPDPQSIAHDEAWEERRRHWQQVWGESPEEDE